MQKLSRSRYQLDRYESDLKGLQDQLASITDTIHEKKDVIVSKCAEVEVFKGEAEKQEAKLLEARGETPAAKKGGEVVAEELIGFDVDDELLQDPEAKSVLEAFRASPHFKQIKQILVTIQSKNSALQFDEFYVFPKHKKIALFIKIATTPTTNPPTTQTFYPVPGGTGR